MLSIERASFLILTYIILIFPIIVAFAIILYNMTSAVIESTSTFLGTLLQVCLMSIGNFNYSNIVFVGEAFGTIYLILFYIFALHFVIVTIAAIYIASFRSTIDMYSYPLDERSSKKWKVKDYLRWLLSWLPNRVLLQLGLITSFELGTQKKRAAAPEEKKEAIPGNRE